MSRSTAEDDGTMAMVSEEVRGLSDQPLKVRLITRGPAKPRYSKDLDAFLRDRFSITLEDPRTGRKVMSRPRERRP